MRTSDFDIFRSAAVLIREHAEDAALEAAKRADALLAKGNIDGQRAWLRIVRAIEELQKTTPAESDVLH